MAERVLSKREWIALGKVFEREIACLRVLQSKASIYTELASRGLVVRDTFQVIDRFGTMDVTGWSLTDRGNYFYCKECERFAPEAKQA